MDINLPLNEASSHVADYEFLAGEIVRSMDLNYETSSVLAIAG